MSRVGGYIMGTSLLWQADAQLQNAVRRHLEWDLEATRGARSSVGGLLRTIGFATAPGCLRVLGVLPGVTIPVLRRHRRLDAGGDGRGRAAGARLSEHGPRHRGLRVGWVPAITIAMVLGLVFGLTLS